jgi:fructose-1,6-bisphosphatase/sedoheptulose 1,7-bisphosphatase-like protein
VGEEGGLIPGATVGHGGRSVDLALDPLEGRGVVARGGNGAMSMIAAADSGALQTFPDMYMRKLAVGHQVEGITGGLSVKDKQ